MEFQTASSRIAQKLAMARLQPNGELLNGALATGSLWLEDGAWYLITNWHNISGCNPTTHTAMSCTGFLPTHAVFNYIVTDPTQGGEIQQKMTWNRKVTPLYDSDNKPLWFEHPTHGHAVDVVALKLFDDSPENSNILSMPINRL